MGTRGRKSSAELTATAGSVAVLQRPDAPYGLTDTEADVWRRIVEAMPADWFGPETYDHLAQYCRHSIQAERVAQLIESLCAQKEFDTEEYDRLLKMQERESRAMSSLATRMRITQQTAYDKSKKRPKSQSKLWGDQ